VGNDKVAAMTRDINGMNDARKAGAIGEMWHCMTRLAKRHKATIRRAIRLRGPDGQHIEGGPEAHAECMGKHFQAKFNSITKVTTPMPDTSNEPLTDSLDALPPMKTYFIEEQEKKAAKAVEEVKRQEAAETLASLQHGRPPQAPNNNIPKGKEPITTQEYKRALTKCKNHKSADKDGLSAELVKLGGEAMETVFIQTFNKILETGELPRQMQIVQLIPIFKKGARDTCDDYRPIAITDFIYKLFSYIIYNRLLPQLEPFLLDEQRGFRPNRGTGDAIFTLQRLAEECRRKGEKIYVAFLDIRQAYDSVPQETMLTILRQYYRVDAGLLDLISLIYTDSQGEVFFDGASSTSFPINIGVKQGCILSPILFSAFLDFVMRQSLPELRRWGVKWEYAREAIAPIMNSIDGNAAAYFSQHPHRNMDQLFRKIIVGLLYADDMALTSSSAIGLQHMVTALNGALKAWGLTLCPKKSRCMVFGKDDDTPSLAIQVEGEKMDQVDAFCYLGTIISTDGTCSAAINDRTQKAWVRLHQSHFIWRLRGLTRKARATFFRCIVLTTLFHGCERWTPSTADMTKLRKNHHNMLAKALNIPPWRRSRVPRAQLRHLMDDVSDVDSYLEMRMLRYTGHLMRRQDEHPTLTSMAMGGQLDMEAFPYESSTLAPGPPQWGPRLGRILRGLLPPKPRVRGPSGNEFDSAEAYMLAQDKFKAASLQEKAVYEVWFKCVGRNKYAMFDEVARERGAWDDLCVEPQVRALVGRGFCKPCKKFYDDNKGLEAHQKRRHPRPPVPSEERDADGEREALLR
jgi:hypothetical protein